MKLADEISIAAGEYLVIGRRDDSGELLRDKITADDFDTPKQRLSDLCRKVLRVIAARDPLIYDFVAVFQNHKKGVDTQGRVVLTNEQLMMFVYAKLKKGA